MERPAAPTPLGHSPTGRFLSGGLALLLPAIALAAPVAIDDSYLVSEDLTLNTAAGPLISADFDSGSANVISFSGDWQVLDRIENSEGASQTYPTDEEGRAWNSADFDPASSSIGPWRATTLPAQGGAVDGFPGETLDTLQGIGAAPSGLNLVTTYLFRNTFTLTAAEAAETNWAANLLIDDGCVIYLNGVEVARANMAPGVVTTETFAAPSDETVYLEVALEVEGLLVTGLNTIAIEVHQFSLGSSDVGLDLSLQAGVGKTGGFVYVDDVFGTNLPDYAEGFLEPGGFIGDGLRIRTGGVDDRLVPPPLASSGGFSRTFTLSAPATLEVSLRYRLLNASALDSNEFGEAILEINGTRYGSGQNGSLVHIVDGGDSGWQSANHLVPLPAGNHIITLGAYTGGTSRANEVIDVYFDDVVVNRVEGGGGGVLENDTVGANPSAAVLSGPSHGTLHFPPDGIFSYTPAPDFHGQDSFTYQVSDETGTSGPATVTLTVIPVNDPPVARAGFYVTMEETPLVALPVSAGVLANDSDAEDDPLTAVLETPPAHGALTLNSNGTFTYLPNLDFFGTDHFTYRASDGADQSAPATVTITVTNVPDPPSPQDDQYTVEENQTLVVQDLSGTIAEELVAWGSEWKFDDTGTDLLTAWRAPGYDDRQWDSGPAELGYGDGDEATIVSFGANANNRHPTTYFRRTFPVADVASIAAGTLWIRRDDGCVIFLNGSQAGIDNIQDNPSYATYAGNAGDDGNLDIEFEMDPALFVEGDNTLAVEIHQANATSTDISFDLRLEVVRTIPLSVLANDTDADGQTLTASLETGPGHGTVVLDPDGTFIYTPDLNYEGSDSFTYLASDGDSATPATVTITITPGPNDIPETQPDAYAPLEDTTFTVDSTGGVLANDLDPDGDPMTAIVRSAPAHGVLNLYPDGSFTYRPDPDFFGADTFTYAASDGTAVSPAQTVTLNVVNTPDPPVARPDVYFTNPGQSFFVSPTMGVLANDFDPDGTILTAELVTNVPSGLLTLLNSGFFFYNPGNNTPGVVTFTYRARDGVLWSDPATVTIHLDTAPVAVADTHQLSEDQTLSVPPANGLLGNDTDAENDPLTAILVTPPAHGTAVVAANGAFTYTPDENFHGADSFTYLANDGPRNSAPATVSLTIHPVNDAPTAVADSYRAIADQQLVVDASSGVLANDFDLDNATLSASLLTAPGQGALVFNADGSFVYTPSPGFNGEDRFTYQSSDGALPSLATTVTIQVGAASDSIVINEIMYHPVSELDSHEFIELANLSDGPVNLGGWRFTSGLNFTFPQVNLPAGGFLVVAADPAEFTAAYGPVDHLVGGWTGALSNSGERIRLVDANGGEVDDLEYSDEGDWAVRTRVLDTGEPGWVWEAAHDGVGASLELVHPRLTNKPGQNWLPSNGGPTPGAPNSVALPESEVAPFILEVAHAPIVPRSTDTVTITARLRDTTTSGLSATLHYRVSTTNPAGFSTAAMADDGLHEDGDPHDGVFGAALPAMPDRTVIEFFISATDGTNTRTWPAPTSIGQVANALYQVDDEVPPEGQGIYRLILSGPENQLFNGIDRDSNARMNCTLVADDCSGPVIRYLCGMRIRGASSRRDNPPPMRLNIPRDRPWDGVTSMNLNSQFTWLQFIGMKLFQASDLPAPDSKRLAVRRNGQDFTDGEIEDFGSWVFLQPLDGDFIDDKFPDDRQGNLYKKVRPDVDWAHRDGDFSQYPLDGWVKQTNSSENNWLDLDNFLRVMNEASGSPDYLAQVEAVADLDQWMRWFAVNALIANGETNASNGADDDYSIYRGVVDPRFVFLPHDLDTILAHGDGSRLTDPRFTIFDMIERGDVLNPLVPLFNDPAVRARYYQALRDLIHTSFSKPRFDALITNHLTGWAPPERIDAVITFMDTRRAYVTGLVDAALGPPPALDEPATISFVTGSTTNPSITEVLALNYSAHPHAGAFPDFVELYNSQATPLPLTGYSMTDDPQAPRKFVFPAGTTILPGEYRVLYADSEFGAPGLHLGFALNGGGEGVFLYNPAGILVDSVVFGPQIPDYSIGRTGAGAGAWRLTVPSPGAANMAQALGDPATLRLNEWLSKPDLVVTEDFIELYNPDPLPVSLGGLAITDDPLNNPQRVVLPPLSFIAANGFALFEAVGEDNATPGRASELPFKLSADHSWIAIYGSNGVEIDRVHALCDAPDQSQGRVTDGGASFARFAIPTPGVSNSTDLRVESRILQGLRITEIMYNPAEGGSAAEFIELRNVGGTPFNLLGVSFTQGIGFDFPAMQLGPGEYVVVVADLAVFTSIYGGGVNVAGEWTGRLDNDGERVRLEIGDLNAGILDFTYQDFWYPSTDGGGHALIIIDERAEPGSWNEKKSWTAGGTARGTPGMDDAFFVYAGADQVVNLPVAATLDATVHYGDLDPADVTLTWSLENGPAVAHFGNPANADTTVNVPLPGRYTFELIATPLVGPVLSGQVTVTFRDTYANWATTHFGSPLAPEADKLADGDLDGLANLLEFALGLDPAVFNSAGLLQPAVDPNGFLTLVYFRPYFESGLISVTAEVSSDLVTWQHGPGLTSEAILASTVDGEFIRVTDLAPMAGNHTRFLRLRVECRE